MKKYKTGLVLSGGGTRGFAHVGVIAALYEKGIKPDVISGKSAGAIVGAFIARGKTPEEIMGIFENENFFKFTKLNLPVDGLMKLSGLEDVLNREIPYKTIEELPVSLFVTVVNLNTGKVEYKNSGPIDLTVLASASVPVLFSPVELNGFKYAAGGLLDNIPVKPVKNDCERIISVNISPINPREKFKNLAQITARTFYISVNADLKEVKKYSSLYIEPEGIDTYDILRLSHARELFELGYNSVKESDFDW